ncbi:bacteriophage abortive infection AbiH family protein [Rhizobium mongolense]|uniref:Abortive infection AbiH-like protein n=2 Tax=Rhizobium mongolense TaxID=57676 RepID=A0ABR6ISZ2_9HYPH|nr:bacteriophage abortive infection AbiH family protein [Rhizobium mongolense]MBB4231014.1 hypothetical protein [Rhizobium mongolense]TVZ66165.1 abortive infection AbiH-like protein [Rhizobium mongolense USDA 1844]
MGRRLFIIGNGFDLAHGIPSSYSDFGRYLEVVDPTVSRFIREYLYVDEDFWSCFEERLGSFDSENVIEYAMNFLASYGDDDWSDSGHHDFEYEIEQIVEGLSSRLRSRFAEWIRLLPMPLPGSFVPVRCIDPSARFLSFNYTPTLQSLYRVPDANIIHIHGRSSEANSQIILGHGWQLQATELLATQIDEDTDVRIAGGYRLIDDYFAETFKPTDRIIDQYQAFFNDLAEVSEISVLGHSLAEVDAPYLFEILEYINPHTTRWTVSYYIDAANERRNFAQFGVPPHLVQFARLRDL